MIKIGVDVLYHGDVSPCRITIGDVHIRTWKKGEIKKICAKAALKLTTENKHFSLAYSDKKPEEKETIVEKPVEEEKLDIDGMKKDELLDLTAKEGIEADYSMTKKELKVLLNEHFGYEE